VERLCSELQRHTVPYWYSKRNIAGAQQWHDEIGQALARCDWIVLVLSPASTKSKWVKHEFLYALNDARYEQRIIPCLYRKCDIKELSWTLSSFQHIDFTGDFDRGVKDLLKVWSLGYKPAPAAKTLGRGKSAKGKSRTS
jgi:hypothetical protein